MICYVINLLCNGSHVLNTGREADVKKKSLRWRNELIPYIIFMCQNMKTYYKYFVVDAFTATPFTGNPAAVIVIEGNEWPDEGDNGERGHAWMVKVAAEFNLSETAFVLLPPQTSGDDTVDTLQKSPLIVKCGLRWRSPKEEVVLCGHATLASAYVLAYEYGYGTGSQDTIIEFSTKFSGKLTARATSLDDGDGSGEGITMSLPAVSIQAPPTAMDQERLRLKWLDALVNPTSSAGDGSKGEIDIQYIGITSLDDSFIVIPSSEMLLGLQPNYEKGI